jgi:hypothetical protein
MPATDTAAQRPLCAEHYRQWQAWLDYRPPPAPMAIITPGNSVREIAARQQRRFEDWRDTIRIQQAAIVAACLAGQRCADGT